MHKQASKQAILIFAIIRTFLTLCITTLFVFLIIMNMLPIVGNILGCMIIVVATINSVNAWINWRKI
jgi:hypothetical protein